MSSNLTTAARVDNLDKEIEELVKAAKDQEGSEEPTQSSEVNNEGSPSESTNETAEQPKVKEDTEVDTLVYWKDRALKAEQRYNVSKPKYDSNIFKLKQENIELQKSRVELSKALNKLRQATSSESTSDKFDKLFDKQTIDVLGQKTVDSIKEAIKSTNDRVDKQEQDRTQDQIKATEKDIADRVVADYNVFLTELTRMVPDQEVINSDPEFIKYLQGTDEFSGKVRMNLLKKAEAEREASWVAKLFLDYKKTKQVKEPTDSINKRIAPSKDGSTTVHDITDNGKVTMAFVDKFYNDVTKGVYKGRYNEQMEIEKQIDQAYLSGNLV